MEKIQFMFDDGTESADFFVLEETKVNGVFLLRIRKKMMRNV